MYALGLSDGVCIFWGTCVFEYLFPCIYICSEYGFYEVMNLNAVGTDWESGSLSYKARRHSD